jgi:glyoxylase-like metal-dependent hydrolase (beta-lactamase superfamily II)
MKSIDAKKLYELIQQNDEILIIDIRLKEVFDKWKIEGKNNTVIKNIPYVNILNGQEEENLAKNSHTYFNKKDLSKYKRIVVICNTGNKSKKVMEGLIKFGYNVSDLDGGMAAWSEFYNIKKIFEEDKKILYQITRPARGCISYVFINKKKAVIFDPLRHIEVYKDLLKGYSVEYIFDTHAHADHISGGPKLSKEMNVPYLLHPYDGIHPIDILPAKIDFNFVKDKQELHLGDSKLLIMHIPGHTLGNLAYLIDDKYLICGDSIFIESIARPDLGGKGETWAPIHYDSLKKLSNLPDDVNILPGHFKNLDEQNGKGVFMSTLGNLKKSNDGLKSIQKGKEEFVEFILSSLPNFPSEYIDIKRVNAGLINPNEEESSILETGKNICALSD